MQGNFLLYSILGANVEVVEGENLEEIPKHLDRKYKELIKEGRKPLLIYGGLEKKILHLLELVMQMLWLKLICK